MPAKKRKQAVSSKTSTQVKRCKPAVVDEKSEIEIGEVDEAMKTSIGKCYFEMPKDFYDFWRFCHKLNPESPEDALSAAFLSLAGPFDLLTAAIPANKSPTFYHVHHRYYYDVPEFQTVLRASASSSQFHVGYYRDDPHTAPVFIAGNTGRNPTISTLGDNLFASVYLHTSRLISDAKKSSEKSGLQNLQHLLSSLKDDAERLGYSLSATSAAMKKRKTVCKGWHGAGLAVPLHPGGVGYRELPATTPVLRKLFQQVCNGGSSSELMELLNFINFANDECDYGMGLEFGVAMFCFGGEALHSYIRMYLPMAYELLGRDEFGEILTAHLTARSQKIT